MHLLIYTLNIDKHTFACIGVVRNKCTIEVQCLNSNKHQYLCGGWLGGSKDGHQTDICSNEIRLRGQYLFIVLDPIVKIRRPM